MLFLCFFFLSCCFSVCMGSATEEFQDNLRALVDLANEELFIPVPGGRFQCSCVHNNLKNTLKQLNKKVSMKNGQIRSRILLMERSAELIIATFHKEHTESGRNPSCRMNQKPLQSAPAAYKTFFEQLHENCQAS